MSFAELKDIVFESFTFPFFDRNNPSSALSLSQNFLSQKDNKKGTGKRGLYIHIPFCDTICKFCPFIKSSSSSDRIERYLKALEKEILLSSETALAQSWDIEAVYIGGGTPSLLSIAQATKLIRLIRTYFNLTENVEITFEVEPKSTSDELFAALAGVGVTRISFGAQTLDPELRQHANLTASMEQIENTIMWGKKYFTDINMDMIVGFPSQDKQLAHDDIANAIKLAPASISLYPLDYATVLGQWLNKIRDGKMPKPAPVNERWEMFFDARRQILESYSEQNMYCFGETESLPPCQYMFTILYGGYHDQYIGLGVGSYSCLSGLTYQNIPDEKQYVDTLLHRDSLPIHQASPYHAYEKSLAYFPKRMTVSLDEVSRLGYLSVVENKIAYLEKSGMVRVEGNKMSLTELGIMNYAKIMVYFLAEPQRRLYNLVSDSVAKNLGLSPSGDILMSRTREKRFGSNYTMIEAS